MGDDFITIILLKKKKEPGLSQAPNTGSKGKVINAAPYKISTWKKSFFPSFSLLIFAL